MTERRSQFLRNTTQNVGFRAAMGAGVVAAALAASGDARAQAAPRFPFPSSNTTALKTGSLTTHELRAQYEQWKQNFLDDCGGSMRVRYPENQGEDTRSEGVGYGMVISAYMGDQATFDGLYAYWQRFANNNLMNWRTFDCGNNSEAGSASDADVDAALGLIIADLQWGGYAAAATSLISSIRTVEMLSCNGRDLLDPGSDGAFGSCGCMNPSYFAPAYYRAFASYDTAGAALWNKAVTDAYATLGDIQNAQSGLVPAWSSANSAQAQNCNFQVAGGGNQNEYQSDAARVPWRIATDLAWAGSQESRSFLSPMLNWVNTANRLAHVVDRFTLAGAALPPFVQNGGGDNNTPLNNATLDATGRRSTIAMGAFATAGIAGNQAQVDSLVGAWTSLYRAGDDLGAQGVVQPHAFNNSLALLYGMLVTGTMWNPLGDDPAPVPEPPLQEQPGSIAVNGDFDEGMRGWAVENLGGIAAEGYAVHQNGSIRLLIQKVTGQPNDQYMIRLKQPVTLQANQNYRLSITARAAEPRPLRVFVGQRDEPYATYLSMDDDPDTEGAALSLTTENQTFEVVQQVTGTPSGAVQLAIDVADSAAEVVIDSISLTPTTDPVTEPGTPIVAPPATDPGTPAAPGTPGGTPAANPGNGDLGGTVNPGVDAPGAPGGGSVSAPNPDNAVGAPAAPTTAPGAATCSAGNEAVCAPHACSTELNLCYDTNTGYVWDPSQRGGMGDWTKPPRGVAGCAQDQVFWPKFDLCYIPETGWIYNPSQGGWVFYGLDFTEGKRPESDGSCAIDGAPGTSRGSSWMLMGLLGAAFGLSVRRRRG